MSKNVAVFVDVANLYYSARGQEVDVDYVALLKSATKGRDLIRAYAYSGLDPENENQRKFIDFLNKNGYKVIHKDIRKFGDGRVKANLDIELVVDLFRLAKRMDIAVIVSGDGDFAPAIRALQDEGVRCEVISFRPNTSSDLIAVADEFIDIMKIASIGREKKAGATKGMSAPEMPAKEVVPEFGFREASPSVAAAALAALREGKEPPRATRGGRAGRGRGRGESLAAAASTENDAEQPVAAATTTINGDRPESEDGRRRRRRRGGRGRGRGGRRPDVEAADVPQPADEIGWVELDDMSQIDDLGELGPLTDATGDERDYTFEEADEATLAELGILEGADATATMPAPDTAEAPAAPRRRRTPKADAAASSAEAESPPKPARRRTTRKAAEPVAATDAAEGEERKPRARRPRSSSGSSRDATAKAGEEAAAKPARRSRAKKVEADAAGARADGDESGDHQGIWQRFRSARGGGSTS